MTPKTLTVAISGSRTLTDRDSVWRVLDERAIYYLTIGYQLHLHLGDAQGVDALAIFWARERQIATHRTIFFASPDLFSCFDVLEGEQAIVAADWRADGPTAGPIRNQAMITGVTASNMYCVAPGCKGAEVLWAVRNANALNRGTDNMIAQANSRNLAIQTYTMNGPVSEWVDQEPAERGLYTY